MVLDLTKDAPTVARKLIGCELVIDDKKGSRGGIITETEAYTATDPASHSFKGATRRNQAMFMPAGTVYIYRIYGMHLCFNIVCGNGDGQAVLIRTLEPTIGINIMNQLRPGVDTSNLCNGPAKLVQALGITLEANQQTLKQVGISLSPPPIPVQISSGYRIGISKATDVLWRFTKIVDNL